MSDAHQFAHLPVIDALVSPRPTLPLAASTDQNGSYRLLDLPNEVLHAIFAFLATDSLINLSFTCHSGCSIVRQLKTWSRHHLQVELNVYRSSTEFETAIKRAVTAPRLRIYSGYATVFVNSVTAITLDAGADHLPIDIALIFRIMDTFTALKEARFIGCLSSGLSLVETVVSSAANTQRPMARWMARGNLKLLDFSDGENMVRKRSAGPLGRNNPPPLLAWGNSPKNVQQFMDLGLTSFQLLFIVYQITYYPQLCSQCYREPSYSWCSPGLCFLCAEAHRTCVQCGTDQAENVLGNVLCQEYCYERSQSCVSCRGSTGWTPCSVAACKIEQCPMCIDGACAVCGGVAYLCRRHTDTQCSCDLLCVTCYKEDMCPKCGQNSGC
ncbi:hypothetical protein M427DRAFT_464175 [Gonapodya prolifera JEL478]|uniref:F-box domain-containing protein n=1 Tax=Gonapodya prolifera (strain JEL478) TaxID=1344416 RepID=A0A139A1R2_GONPJ|nr:hypothetical protein M427DRAFT_464175 [Gonapodya prolifera JEL478]|eukprot:KXS10702.1 hypothetical protein M427DRAFT_464175 [Gonapodya prolifera JEL478]